uniref:Bromodomain adjacent to zinc finger domain, 2A n=1 Tax=Esox lucius TaxID=8010 RepID=A0A6Q2XFK4_ESOLU
FQMEANNHFNYGTHSSVAANSGLKLSSGDSLYTNGSSMSFPQQGKNLNGEMNVNGITTVIGPSVPGPHPPTASYPHMSNHHQGSMGYDYLWGAQPQYSPAMGSSPGHGMHQKQPSPAVMQQQNQHHFQGHGQYQLNGGMPGSHQPPVAAPPNVTLTGGQYWNRANPGQQQSGAAMALGYNSHGVYGAYQSQVHPGIVPSQQHLHQQQPQQPPQPPAHQQTPEAFKDVDIGFNGLERASVAQQLLKSDSYPHKPPGPPMGSAGDYFQCSEPPMAPHHEMTSLARESVLPTPPHSIPSPPPAVSAPPSVVSTPPRVSATPAGSKPLMGASGPPVVSSSVTSTPPGNSASPMSSAPSPPVVGPPPRLSSPPLMVQGLRPSVTASTSPSMASPASVSAPPSKPLVPPLPDTSSKSPAASVPHPGSAPTSVSVACQITPVTSAPPAMISNTTMGSAPTHSMSTPMSALQYMVQGTRPPPLTSSPPALSGVPKEQFWTPSISEAAPPRTISGSPPAVSAPSVAASAACTAVTRAPPLSIDLCLSWKREIRVKKSEDRLKGETWYYSPCGRRMKQFPEVIKYLNRHQDTAVTREHFSFSPRMPVGDFYEERDTAEGVRWCLLANEEVPSIIMAITGRRGRPPNPDKEKPRPRVRRTKGSPVRKPGRPPKPKMVDLLSKVDARILKRLEAKEALTEEDKEKLVKIKKKMKRKVQSKAKALAKAQAEAEAVAQAALVAKKQAERRAQAQRRLEERKRQQMIMEELKKPTEDMCLTDHRPLPELSRIPGVVLSGVAFSHCLAVVEFLHSYGKVLGLHIPQDVPSLSTLQEGLLGLGDSQGEVQDLLIKLVEAALHDPGLPSYYQSVKILGEKLADVELTRSTVSEGLRIFLESHGFDMEVCNVLRTKTFHALSPDTKAAILAFLVEELNGSNIVISEIDNTLENMATYRKNKWIIEGKLRRLKAALARRTGRSEDELCLEERRRSSRVADEDNLSMEEGGPMERGSRRRTPKEDPTNASVPELERQIDKLTKRQVFFRKKLLQSSHSLRAVSLGQDRFRRRYWVLPHLGGVLVEGPEEILGECLFTVNRAPPRPFMGNKTMRTFSVQDVLYSSVKQTLSRLQSVPAPSDQPAHVTPTTTPAKPVRRRRRGSRGSSPARRIGGRGAAAKRRGRPPTTLFQEIEQQYFTQLVVKPIPASMVRGWWWIKEPDELTATLQALHPRGIREKVLHKHLAKHMEYLAEVCTRPINDPIFQVMVKEGETLLESIQQPWQVQERALETDVSALCWVEDLEQRVIAADLHLKPYTVPEADSTRDDLQYYEHDADPRDDWIVRTKKEWSDLPRVATHPLDLAVLRLANLERNIDRRYLKEPLWNLAEVVRLAPLTLEESQMGQMDVISLESEITPRLRTWRQALDRCRSAPQLCLCLLQLEKAIAWERSVVKVTCQVCRKGDNDEYLLLCDGCDRGCHMYCLRPKVTQVPEGDWFCPTCSQRSYKQRTRVKKRRYEDDSSDEETAPCRRSGTRHPGPASSSSSRYSGDWGGGTGFSPAKRRRMTTRNQPDLTYCEIILMEMESHPDAWPFLEPVNPRMVPGYRRIIKNPMDFLTMRERLLQGGYCSCEEFAADAHLVFNNCEQFNEDTSEVGMAGHSMKRFFENRWAEFYESKDK